MAGREWEVPNEMVYANGIKPIFDAVGRVRQTVENAIQQLQRSTHPQRNPETELEGQLVTGSDTDTFEVQSSDGRVETIKVLRG